MYQVVIFSTCEGLRVFVVVEAIWGGGRGGLEAEIGRGKGGLEEGATLTGKVRCGLWSYCA